MFKKIMNPNMERIVKIFLEELGIKDINKIDTYQDLIKETKVEEGNLRKLLSNLYEKLKEEPHEDYIYILLYLDKLNYPLAVTVLGLCYYDGIYYEQSYENAGICYNKASEMGDSWAQYLLANMYMIGKGVSQDINKAINLYTDSAKQGHKNAQFNLGLICESNKFYQEALYWYIKAAEQEHKDAMFNLANMYQEGKGIPKDMKKAIGLYTQAANLGNVKAPFNLGLICESNKAYEKALYWYIKAVELENTDAMFNLANMYQEGKGIPKDMKKAIGLYTQAANLGNVKAQSNLGIIFDISNLYESAIYWYTKAAESKDVDAIFNLALMYYKGRGVNRDVTKAIDLYTQGAKLGHVRSQYNLAVIYHCGEVVTQNIDNAIYWYTQAANLGNVDAQHALGSIYEDLGDNNKAAYWYNLSRKNENLW